MCIIIKIQIRRVQAELHVNKYQSGLRCILRDGNWYTPIEFCGHCGADGSVWKNVIRCGSFSLNEVIAENFRTHHAESCTCQACNESSAESRIDFLRIPVLIPRILVVQRKFAVVSVNLKNM